VRARIDELEIETAGKLPGNGLIAPLTARSGGGNTSRGVIRAVSWLAPGSFVVPSVDASVLIHTTV
jgi:hypothetical protein